MKIGTLTWDNCQTCSNYDSNMDWCNLEELDISADGEDVVCNGYERNELTGEIND